MSQAQSIQAVTQVSVLGQLHASLLQKVFRRLRSYAESESLLDLHEDVLTRGAGFIITCYMINQCDLKLCEAAPNTGPMRDEDILRVRGITSEGITRWTIDALGRPVPVRDNAEVLIRSIASTPVLEGDAGALAVALGYSDRKFAFRRKGRLFTSGGGLTNVMIYQLHVPSESSEPLDSQSYIIEVVSHTAHKPVPSTASAPVQALRDNAIQRTLEVKSLLKGLVDVTRVE